MYFIIFTNKMVIISHLSCRSLLIIYKNYIIRKKYWHITPALFQTQNLTYSAFYIVWICHIVIFITEQVDIPLTVSWSTRFCASCPKIRHPAVYTVFSGYHIIPRYFLLYDIILPVYRHSGISGMSYDYHTFTGLFWHIFIIYPGNPPQLSTSCLGNRTYGLCGWFPDCRDPVFAIRHPVFTAFIRVCLSHIWIVWMPSGRRGVSPSGTIYLPSHIMGQNIYWYRLMLPHPHTPSK